MNLAELFVRVSADISGLQKNMSAAERSVDKLADRAGKLGQKLTLGVTAPLTALSALSIRTAASFDSLTKGLEAVAGSAGAAEAQLARLREIAKLPAVDLKQATQASIAFQAIGKSAEFAERTIKGVANAVALSGGGASEFSGVLRQMRQIASMGKLMGEELNTILENAPAMAKALQNAFGTTSAEAIRALNLTTEEFFERLQQGMESLPKVAGGAANSFDNLKASIEQAAAVLGGQLLPAVLPVVEGFATMLEGMERINPETVRLGIAFGAAAAAAGPLITVVANLTKAILFLRAASLATVGLVGAGGALALGLAALTGLFVKNKLEALAAAGAVDDYTRSIGGLTKELAERELGVLSGRQSELVAEFERTPAKITIDGGYEGPVELPNPRRAELREQINQVRAQRFELEKHLSVLNSNPAPNLDTSGIVGPTEEAIRRLDELQRKWEDLHESLNLNRLLVDAKMESARQPNLVRQELGQDTFRYQRYIGMAGRQAGLDLTPVTARGEKTESQAAEIEAVALAREAEREAIQNLGVAISSLSRSAARGVEGVKSMIASIDLLKKGDGSSLSGLLNIASGAIGGISAITQIGGSLLDLGKQIFGQSQATRELIAVMKSNTDRLRELKLAQAGFKVGQEQVDAAARVASEFKEEFQRHPLLSGTKFDEILARNGLTLDQFVAIVESTGAQIKDANGKILLPAVAGIAEYLGLFKVSLEKTVSSMTNVPSVFANALRRFQASTAGISGSAPVSTAPPKPQERVLPYDGPGGVTGAPVSTAPPKPQERVLPYDGPGGVTGAALSISGNTINVYANDPAEFARQMEAYGQRVAMRAGYSAFALVGG